MDRERLKELFSWKHRWVRWTVGFLVWTLLGVSFAIRSYLTALQNNSNPSWKGTLSAYLTDFYLWGLVSPFIFLLARRFELWRYFPRNVFIHVVAGLIFSIVVLMLTGPVYWYFGYPNLERTPTLYSLFRVIVYSPYYLHTALTIYWTTLIVAHASQYHRGMREEETRAARLATQLAQAQLRALEMQIHPHFLFNTLNSISALLHQDVEAADRMIAQLGNFLRLTLRRSSDPVHERRESRSGPRLFALQCRGESHSQQLAAGSDWAP